MERARLQDVATRDIFRHFGAEMHRRNEYSPIPVTWSPRFAPTSHWSPDLSMNHLGQHLTLISFFHHHGSTVTIKSPRSLTIWNR